MFAKIVPTFANRGCHIVIITNPPAVKVAVKEMREMLNSDLVTCLLHVNGGWRMREGGQDGDGRMSVCSQYGGGRQQGCGDAVEPLGDHLRAVGRHHRASVGNALTTESPVDTHQLVHDARLVDLDTEDDAVDLVLSSQNLCYFIPEGGVVTVWMAASPVSLPRGQPSLADDNTGDLLPPFSSRCGTRPLATEVGGVVISLCIYSRGESLILYSGLEASQSIRNRIHLAVMFKLVVLAVMLAVSGVCAAPGNLLAAPLAYSSPLLAAPAAYATAPFAYAAPGPVVTAHSSQVVSQRFNGLAAPLLAPAPLLAAYAHAPAAVYFK
uniref:Uncharacterized protein n=1 Tax=Timema shepardi TaxID=629360 RepID=A0A7R9FYM6_TIMSH|nr:unnamed protein product [Timema shepardi]